MRFSRKYSALEKINMLGPREEAEWSEDMAACIALLLFASPWPSASLCAQFPARALFPALAPLCA